MLGDKIKTLRKHKQISLRDLAKTTGLSKSSLSDIENNKSLNPTITSLKKVATALGINVEELLKENTFNIHIESLLTIEDMIMFCKDIIDNKELENADQYIQLLSWLEELQELREFKKRILEVVEGNGGEYNANNR